MLSQRELTEKLLKENAAVNADELASVKTFGNRNTIYDKCKSGEIASFRSGKSIIIPTAPLRRMLGIEDKAVA